MSTSFGQGFSALTQGFASRITNRSSASTSLYHNPARFNKGDATNNARIKLTQIFIVIYLIFSNCLFNSATASQVDVAKSYGAPYHECYPGYPYQYYSASSVDDAYAKVWEGYKRYWGVQPYGSLRCDYSRNDKANGEQTGIFSGYTLLGDCGGGNAICGTGDWLPFFEPLAS